MLRLLSSSNRLILPSQFTLPTMDSSRRRPSLPPLETNIPLPERQSTSVPAPPKPSSLKNIPVIPVIPLRKKAETPVTPTLSPQEGGEENIRPLSGSASCGYGVSFKPLVIDSSAPKTKTDYYNDAFTFRGSPTSPQERVTRDSIIVAELKTNIQVCTSARCGGARSRMLTIPSPSSKAFSLLMTSHFAWPGSISALCPASW